jgi:SpoVK/Ycf46/Vps4 family AAA+-type ATPase
MTAANMKGDRRAVQRAMEAILADTKRSPQANLPGLDRAYLPAPRGQSMQRPQLPDRVAELVYEVPACRRLSELVLNSQLVREIDDFLFEYSNSELLRQNSLEPRHKILLVGPPGNGKTSLAEVFATELGLSLLTVRYDAIVDSYLGETSTRVRKLIEYASETPCVLFFDEFETVGKERSDSQETGEIKRVVSSLLMQIDRLPSHAIVVCATNHPEMLDRAIWRRFELQLEVPPPGRDELRLWFERFESSFKDHSIGVSLPVFLDVMEGLSMSEVEAFTLNVRRKLVLSRGTLAAADAVRQVLQGLKARMSATTTTTKKKRGQRGKSVPDHQADQGGPAA